MTKLPVERSSRTSTILPTGRVEGTAPMRTIGQVKYARREGAVSIYKDATRNTANDNAASRKAESSTIYECEDEKTGEEY